MATGGVPEKAIRAQIAPRPSLVQIARMSDGSRRITHVTEITGNSEEVISLQDIFLFERRGIGPNGKVPGTLLRHRHRAQVRRKAPHRRLAVLAQSAGALGGDMGIYGRNPAPEAGPCFC